MIESVSAVAMQAGNALELTSSTQAFEAQPTGMSFTEAMKSMATQTVGDVQNSEAMSMAAMHGKASLQDVVQAAVKAEVAVETAISIRNKVIESYQEIMRMPI